MSDRVAAIATLMDGAGFDARASTEIMLEMWEKWVFLASLAGATCLMRAPVGDIAEAPGGADLALGLFEECRHIAAAEGYQSRETLVTRAHAVLTAKDSALTASMLRDIERKAPIEADQIVGDLLDRGRRHGLAESEMARLRIVYTHLKVYERARVRPMARV